MSEITHELEQHQIQNVETKTVRDIDQAMSDERPAKVVIRDLWLEQIRDFAQSFPEDDVPLYLTLSGAEGRDIKLLAEHNIIQLTEIGGLAPESQKRVIAIEQNSQAVLTLQKQLPGLQIINQNFGDIIQGHSQLRFPTNKEHIEYCCAKIINLDLQSELRSEFQNGSIIFKIFNWIQKISLLHAEKKPTLDWCLCLTLNATVNQPKIVGEFIQSFLKENYLSCPDFQESCRTLLGDEIQDIIIADDPLNLDTFNQEVIQKILMIFVPKKISSLVHSQNWQVKTIRNLCYGGNENHAPMVSWILYFEWDDRAAASPQTVYIESLGEILSYAKRVEEDGQISDLN